MLPSKEHPVYRSATGCTDNLQKATLYEIFLLFLSNSNGKKLFAMNISVSMDLSGL